MYDHRADYADDDDRAQSLPQQRVRVHHVEAKRPRGPAFDEKAQAEHPGDAAGIEDVEDGQSSDDRPSDGEGLGAGAGHGVVS